ncbi:MAG TPA: hypothetical protein VFH45_08780 [Acidimicrobiales bacterium]|nr:hypothetical protein [Acidimicrobiales bacterium]
MLDWGRGPDDAALAVIAHGLLNSVSAVQMGAHALKESWRDLSDAQRNDIIQVVADQAGHIRGILQDLIRGLPPEVIRALNTLDHGAADEPPVGK